MGTNHEIEDLVLYDGICSFCNNSVKFILAHERSPKLKFASLQSDLGKELLQNHGLPVNYTESLLFIQKDRLYAKSKAAIKISSYLKFPWNCIAISNVLPTGFADAIYDLIAKNRYKIMGQSEACVLPSSDQRHRFFE